MMPQRGAFFAIAAASCAAFAFAAAGCNNPASAPAPPPPPPSNGAMFITDFTNNTVTVYGQNANCSCNPARQISGSNTGLLAPLGIAVGNNGAMYVANTGHADVLEFPTLGKGNIAPSFEITGFSNPTDVAVDSAQNVYVVDKAAQSILIFPPASATPARVIFGPATGLNGPDFLTLDASGNIWVANQTGQSVEEFASNAAGNAAPVTVIAGSNTSLSSPQGLAFSPNGNLFVAINSPSFNGVDAVLVFSGWGAGVNNISPANAICGGQTGINNPTGIAINSLGTVFVVNSATAFGPGYETAYAANNIACPGPLPNASVSGPAMLNPVGIALH